MIKRRVLNNEIVYDILNYETESDLEFIYNLLLKKYSVNFVDRLEGPGGCVLKIEIDKNNIAIVNNNFGNFLRPLDESAKSFIEIEFSNLNLLFM